MLFAPSYLGFTTVFATLIASSFASPCSARPVPSIRTQLNAIATFSNDGSNNTGATRSGHRHYSFGQSQVQAQAPQPTGAYNSATDDADVSITTAQQVPATTNIPTQASLTPKVVYTSPITTAAPTTAAAAAVTSASASTSDDTGDWFSIANKWRVKMGHPAFVKSDLLVSNAKDTVVQDNGVMAHHGHSGTFAETLAPGKVDNFEYVYVGGWLCEAPSTAGLDGICATESVGWYYSGTGHADILNGDYKSIGCAFYAGIWGCDLA